MTGGMTKRGALLFAALCVVWGIPYRLIRVAVRELTPATLVFARTALGALLLLPLATSRGNVRPVLRRWLPLLAFAAVEIAVPWLLLSSAEQRLSSSLSGLLVAAVPLVGVVTTWLTGRSEDISRTNAVGLALGLLGVAALVGLDVGGANAPALAEMALVVIGYAVGPIILSRFLSDLPALGVIAVSLALTSLVYAPIAAFQLPSALPAGRVLASVLALALVCTALAFLLFFALIAEIGPVRATVITYVNPAVAAVLGVAVLGESFSAGMGIGFALVLAGSVLATRRRRRDETVRSPIEPEAEVEAAAAAYEAPWP
ncbi:MAG: DMT family transporter [Gaiellaceae bacterium]